MTAPARVTRPKAPTQPYDPQTNVGPQPMADPALSIMQSVMAAQKPVLAEQAGPSQVNEQLEPNVPDFIADLSKDDQKKLLARALYGWTFPGALDDPQPQDWADWARSLWAGHRAAVEKHLHLVERNRLFRSGQQWVSSRGRGPWREPMKPVDSARVVCNKIDKALDQRLQILTDQRPGFHCEPKNYDPDEKRKAEARQMALEYQYDQQGMSDQMAVAGFWAQTDGIAAFHTYWDPEAGQWDERMAEGEGSADGVTTIGKPNWQRPLGDLRTKVQRVEQFRVSANATKTEKPYYVVIREVIPAAEAAYAYGVAGVNPNASTLTVLGAGDVATDAGMNRWVLDQTTIGEGDRLRNQETVERFTVYVDRQADILPEGLQMVVVGDAVVWGPGPLLFKCIPVAFVRDGSTDPSFYPRPIMEQWLDHQVRINALLSAAVDSIRVNKGGRFLSRPGAIVKETFIGGGTSVMEVNGAIGSLDDVIKPVPGFTIGADVQWLFQQEVKAFEDASGWNDTSRGQISGDASGRAILAAREQLERVFAPGVQAVATAYTDWAKINVAGMAFGYDVPRDLSAVGNGRPDLAQALTGDMFDGFADVKVEAETLMPMPRVYRQFQLDNWLDRGLITPQQYMRRQSTALIQDLDTPDEDQEARAKRIVQAIKFHLPVPEMRWQDNESIHQDILEREIILQDDLDPPIIAMAQQRWSDLAAQAQQKQNPQVPAPPHIPGPVPNQPGPAQQPLAQGNPSVGGAPALGGPPSPGQPTPAGMATDQGLAAHVFDRMTPR